MSRLKLLAPWPALALCSSLIGCMPHSYVVLLENDNGTTGAIEVKNLQGERVVVDQAQSAAALDGSTPKLFQLSNEDIQEQFAAALSAKPLPAKVYLLKFETGGSNLTPESQAMLPSVLDEISKRPGADISIIGHTDTVGDADKNVALGLIRARFVANQLMERHIKVAGQTITSHGESNPLKPTPDNTDEAENRRVEVTVR